MSQLNLNIYFPESLAGRGIYLIIIILNALLSFRIPNTIQGLLLTCLVYGLLLYGTRLTKLLALLFSIVRLVFAFNFTSKIPIWTMLVTYSLSIMFCWILFKLSLSVDNQNVLNIFNVKLMTPPSVYLRNLDGVKATLAWEHPLDPSIDGYQIELNNHLICKLDPHERGFELPNLRMNSTYRIRVWAYSKTRGRAASSYIAFHTVKEIHGTNKSPTVKIKEVPTSEDVEILEKELEEVTKARDEIQKEIKDLQEQEKNPPTNEDITEAKIEAESIYEVQYTKLQGKYDKLLKDKEVLSKKVYNTKKDIVKANLKIKKLKEDINQQLSEIEHGNNMKIEFPKTLSSMEKKYESEITKVKKEIVNLKNDKEKLSVEYYILKEKLEKKNELLKKRTIESTKVEKEFLLEKDKYERAGINVQQLQQFKQLLIKYSELKKQKADYNNQLNKLNNTKLNLLQTLGELNRLKSQKNNPLTDAIKELNEQSPIPSELEKDKEKDIEKEDEEEKKDQQESEFLSLPNTDFLKPSASSLFGSHSPSPPKGLSYDNEWGLPAISNNNYILEKSLSSSPKAYKPSPPPGFQNPSAQPILKGANKGFNDFHFNKNLHHTSKNELNLNWSLFSYTSSPSSTSNSLSITTTTASANSTLITPSNQRKVQHNSLPLNLTSSMPSYTSSVSKGYLDELPTSPHWSQLPQLENIKFSYPDWLIPKNDNDLKDEENSSEIKRQSSPFISPFSEEKEEINKN